MLNRDITKTSLSLIKEKIIKTDTVLNIVCEKNAAITDLQSKLEIVTTKFIEKCEESNSLAEQLDLKNKECYTLSSKLVKLQEQHDQLIFEAAYAQTEYNKLNNDNYLTIQNLESEMIKLNSKTNRLENDNELLKLGSSITASAESRLESKLNATIKDYKSKLKNLQEDLNESKNLHNNSLKDLITTKDEYKRLEFIYNNYKSSSKHDTNGSCAKCTNKENIMEATLYKSSADVQKEKYQKLLSQFEELVISFQQLKNDNIKVAEKYSALMLQSQSTKAFVNNSSQTTENQIEREENVSKSLEKVIFKRIDINEEALRIRQLKTDKTNLNLELMKSLNEKRILQTDLKCFSRENTLLQNKYKEIKLERDSLLLENQIKSIGISIATQTTNVSANFLKEHEIITDNKTEVEFSINDDEICDTVVDLGLNLSCSDSESEKELESYDHIVEEWVKLKRLLSPLPKTPTLSRYKSSNTDNNELYTDLIPGIHSPSRLITEEEAQKDMFSIDNNLIDDQFGNVMIQSAEQYQKLETNLSSSSSSFDSRTDLDYSIRTFGFPNESTSQIEALNDCSEFRNDPSVSCGRGNSQIEGEVNEKCQKLPVNETTQTDFIEFKENIAYLSKIDIGCQSLDIVTEERATQYCQENKQKNIDMGIQVDIRMKEHDIVIGRKMEIDKSPKEIMSEHKISKLNKLQKRYRNRYVKDHKTLLKKALQLVKSRRIKELSKRNKCKKVGSLKLAMEMFRNHFGAMSFEKGDSTKIKNNSLLFGNSNHTLRQFYRFIPDLKNAMNVANKQRLSAVIINGMNCDKKMLENLEGIDKEIDELYKTRNNRNVVDVGELKAILDEDRNLIGFGNENITKSELSESKVVTSDIQVNDPNNIYLNKKKNILKRKLTKRVSKHNRIDKIQRLNDLRIRFELENKEIEDRSCINKAVLQERCFVEGKGTNDNKDNVSEDVDSGYTDGSETSEIIKELIINTNPRILRSTLKRKRSVSSSSPKAIVVNKKRIAMSKELFGSDDSDLSQDGNFEEKVCAPKKPSPKSKKSSVFDKMKKIIRTYNPRARNDLRLNKKIPHEQEHFTDTILNRSVLNLSSKKMQNVALECEKVKEDCKSNFKNNQELDIKNNNNTKNKISRSKKQPVETLTADGVQNASEASQINVENKEHLMQRFISDIPIFKLIQRPIERTTFKKPLSTKRIISKEINVSIIETVSSEKNTSEIVNEDNRENLAQQDKTSTSEENNVEEREISSHQESHTEEEEEIGSIQTELSDDDGLKLLNKLIQNNCEESIVSTVQEKISRVSSQHISRLIICCFYKYRSEGTEPSHTPFAPSLSPTYKTLIGFANLLSQRTHVTLFSDILDQLEAKFLLHTNTKTTNTDKRCTSVTIFSLEQVLRVYVSICMLRTDVLRLRRFLCDMAYYQKDGFYGLMYAVFTIWPMVLPKKIDEDEKPLLKENDALLMSVLMFFVFKKRNSEVYMHYRPFLSTFACGYYKYKAESLHMKLIFDELVEKFTTSDLDILAYALIILLQRITNVELLHLLRSESFNNVFKASDKDKLIAKSKLLWLLDKIIPQIKARGDRSMIVSLEEFLRNLDTKVENDRVKNFIGSCIRKLNK